MDYNLAKHPHVDASNLEVIKLMQSFKSKEYVRENFSWQHYYRYLTSDGIEFLRTFLNLPSKIVPNTLKKSAAFCSQVLKSQLCNKCVSFEFALT
jgi:small subunit ribosomal protein S10e